MSGSPVSMSGCRNGTKISLVEPGRETKMLRGNKSKFFGERISVCPEREFSKKKQIVTNPDLSRHSSCPMRPEPGQKSVKRAELSRPVSCLYPSPKPNSVNSKV